MCLNQYQIIPAEVINNRTNIHKLLNALFLGTKR